MRTYSAQPQDSRCVTFVHLIMYVFASVMRQVRPVPFSCSLQMGTKKRRKPKKPNTNGVRDPRNDCAALECPRNSAISYKQFSDSRPVRLYAYIPSVVLKSPPRAFLCNRCYQNLRGKYASKAVTTSLTHSNLSWFMGRPLTLLGL
jgi:hypothetical protein